MDNNTIFHKNNDWIYDNELTPDNKTKADNKIEYYLKKRMEYINTPNTEENKEKIKELESDLKNPNVSGFIYEIYNPFNSRIYSSPDAYKNYPVVCYIMEKLNNHYINIENNSNNNVNNNQNTNSKGYARTLNKGTHGHSLTDDYGEAAFWQAPLIIVLASIMAIILATILYFIK